MKPANNLVSLRDVAAHAGVSFQTVSKVLKGEGRVAPATRQRIVDSAAALGYVPNTLARSLVTRNSHSLGFIASGLRSFVLTPLMQGAEREAQAHGYLTIFTLADGHERRAEELVRQLVERRVDGIVNASLTLTKDRGYADLLRTLTSSVTIFPVAGGSLPIVGEDGRWTGLLATRHLLRLGHTQIATLIGEATAPRESSGRLGGYREALAEAGITPDPSLLEPGDWTGEGGYAAMNRLLDRAPQLTAVFAHNDHMAIGAIRAVLDRGLRVPQDIAIIGVDDIDLAPYTVPPLTTVRISFENIGAAAVRLLLDRLADPNRIRDRIILPVELVVRQSCGASP